MELSQSYVAEMGLWNSKLAITLALLAPLPVTYFVAADLAGTSEGKHVSLPLIVVLAIGGFFAWSVILVAAARFGPNLWMPSEFRCDRESGTIVCVCAWKRYEFTISEVAALEKIALKLRYPITFYFLKLDSGKTVPLPTFPEQEVYEAIFVGTVKTR